MAENVTGRMLVSQVDNLKEAPAIPARSAMMAMCFSDANVMIICLTDLCGLKFHGDAAVDAWRNWYQHLAERHPEWGEP